MYGKSFESKYEGSLVGAGFHVWAVWDYVIAKTRFSTVELNPKMLAFILAGADPNAERLVKEAIEFLCGPDPESRTKGEDGRRLVREGQFQYRVVNWEKYQGIQSELALKEYNRIKQAEYRARKRTEQSIEGMNPKQKGAYRKGRAAVAKASEATLREAEVQGRTDQVEDSLAQAHRDLVAEREAACEEARRAMTEG